MEQTYIVCVCGWQGLGEYFVKEPNMMKSPWTDCVTHNNYHARAKHSYPVADALILDDLETH